MPESLEEVVVGQKKTIKSLETRLELLEKIANIKEVSNIEVELLTAKSQVEYYTKILWEALGETNLIEIVKAYAPQSEAAILQMEVNKLRAILEKDNECALGQEATIKSLKRSVARWQAEYYISLPPSELKDGWVALIGSCLSQNESLLFQMEVTRLVEGKVKTEADEVVDKIRAKLAEPPPEPIPEREVNIEQYEIEGRLESLDSLSQFVSDLVTWAVPEVVDNWSEIAEGKSYAEQKKALAGHREILDRKTKDRINKINNASRLEPDIPARKLLSSVSSKCPGIELGYQETEVGTLFSLALTKEYFERIEFSTQDAVIEWLKQYRRLS